MILKRIAIKNLGAIDYFECDFEDDFNIVDSLYVDETSYAIRLVLNHCAFGLSNPWINESTQIEALLAISQKEYLLTAKPDPNTDYLCLSVFDGEGNERTQEYFYLTSHCAEHDLCEVFEANSEKIFFKPIQYLDEDRYYSSNELSKYTDGLSETKSFRSYLKSYIKNFKPELIRDGKLYELYLRKDGRYAVRYKDGDNMPVFLGESERTLFRYLCFLRTAEFWQSFEQLRNLHCVKKPILIENFLERLDESVDIRDVAERTRRLNRQIIILTIKMNKRKEYQK